MGTRSYSDEFKRDAVQQVRVRGYPVREASQHLGVSSHSLCKWLLLYAEPSPKRGGINHEAENRRLKQELARVTEVREIPKDRHGPRPVCARQRQHALRSVA
jgi:transposase